MSVSCAIATEDAFSAEMQRLLVTASRQPWGPGREIDETVHHLHEELLVITARMGSSDEQPEDAARAHKIDHELRNKLMIFHYHEQKRRIAAR